jgi:hypothetical protein
MRRGLGFLVLLLLVGWFLSKAPTESASTSPSVKSTTTTPAPRLTSEQLLTKGRELFDQWQNAQTRQGVALEAVRDVMAGLEHVPTSDQHFATSRQAVEVLRPIRAQLAAEEIERQRLATEKAIKEAKAHEAGERKRVAEDAAGRKVHASELEHGYLRRGMDVRVTVKGDRNTTLRFRWVLISRPVVYNFINDRRLMANLKDRGFRQLVMTDGYDSTWRQKID